MAQKTPRHRHLWIVRHAKAASSPPEGGNDRDRPLNGRGRKDALALGRRMSRPERNFGLEAVPAPQRIICSAAVRTRQTADLLEEGMEATLPIESYRSLYEADEAQVLAYLQEVSPETTSLVVVGHNPTMHALAWQLTDPEDPFGVGRAALDAQGFATCSVAVLRFTSSSWRGVRPATGRLVGLFAPPY
jgi:phosphohistidine phosphatase